MLELEKQIIKINIPSTEKGFFSDKEFQWDNIPEFVVITGVNGSGKTKLLEYINTSIKPVNKITDQNSTITYKENKPILSHEKYYHSAYAEPKVVSNQITHGTIENKKLEIKERLLQAITYCSNAKSSLNNIDINGHRYLGHSSTRGSISFTHDEQQKVQDYLKFVATKESIDKEFINSNGEWISDKIYKIVITSKVAYVDEFIKNLIPNENSLATINISELFLHYARTETKIKSKVCDEDISSEERKKEIQKEFKKIFHIGIAPWELINNTLKKYGFKYKVQKPDDEVYHLSFSEDGIFYDHLSTGEKIIFYLVCSGYSGVGGIQNKTCLLLLDELDAYLNPLMSKMFVEIVQDILVKQFKIQVIMTTHSPSTVSYTPEENLFWMEKGKISPKDKMEIVHQLASGFTLKESSCPFMSYLIDPTKPYYILVEGYTDRLHLQEACKKLRGDYQKSILGKCNFIQLGGTKGINVKTFIDNFAHGKKIIAIFDKDKSGHTAWADSFRNQYSKDKQNDCIKQKDINCIGILLKSENIADYIAQIDYGYLPIELLYTKEKIDLFNDSNSGNFLGLCKYENEAKDHYILSNKLPNFDNCFYIKPNLSLKIQFTEFVKDFISEDFAGFKPSLNNVLQVIKNFDE